MTSSRLPGKALLALGGLPAVVLAARRAANAGRQVVVATSGNSTDDLLAATVTASGIACVRGSLEDVLDRFVQASCDLPAAALIVRLTADNVFPDGEFVERALAAFTRSGQAYWSVRHPDDGLPYGMSAEVTTVGLLREASRAANSAYDREHVTSWIRRNVSNAGAAGWLDGQEHLRCTFDDARDYQLLVRVFDGIAAPQQVSWKDLCTKLAAIGETHAVPVESLHSPALLRFCLGTAQLGIEYGAVNRSGQPTAADAVNIVRTAIGCGVLSLDTARAYGTAEAVLGEALHGTSLPGTGVVTKLDPLSHLADDTPDAALFAAIDASVASSCRDLGVESLDTLLLHRWAHFHGFGGRLWHHLERLRTTGLAAGHARTR